MAGQGNSVNVNVNDIARRRKYFIGSGTLYPGTVGQIKAATAQSGGQWTLEAYNRSADGDRPQGPIYVILEDELAGKDRDQTYDSGEQVSAVVPWAGDEFNMLAMNITGTGSGTLDVFAIGDLLIVNDGDGKLTLTTGSPESEPFMAMEALASLSADTWLWCVYTGY